MLFCDTVGFYPRPLYQNSNKMKQMHTQYIYVCIYIYIYIYIFIYKGHYNIDG